MPRSGWDAPWQHYPASKPLPVEGGLASSKRRGEMAESWWSKRFVDVLESYGLGGRMQRGRRYARQGQVMSLDVTPGLLAAQVQGSRRTPYLVTVQSAPPSERQWAKLDDAFRSRVGFAAQLLAGEVPPALEDAFRDAGVSLFPATWNDVRANCNCPDWGNPCKHIAAVLYVYADQLDADPWLLLRWRGRTREELLGHVRALAPAGGADHGLPVWWPLTPGRAQPHDVHAVAPIAETPDPQARVLHRLQPLGVDVAGTPFETLLAPLYAAITQPPDQPTE
jgi:uncharacterized Zn finger protein